MPPGRRLRLLLRAAPGLAVGWCSLVLAACQVQAPPPERPPAASSPLGAEAQAAAAVITPELLRAPIAKLSSNQLEGRGPSTEGDRAARAYLAEQLRSLGLQPGRGADGWEQPVELVGITTRMPASWSFERGGKSLSLASWEQFIVNSGVQSTHGSLEHAEVVFVGYGIEAPEYGWDDFKGRDLKGKVLLFLNNDPDWEPSLFGGATRLYYGRWTYKYESAARHGAAGALIIHTAASAGYPFQVVQSSWGGQVFELPSSGEPTLRTKGWLTEDAARALVASSGKDLNELVAAARSRDFAPVSLEITTSLAFENQVERVKSANVYGIIRGRDPQLADQYVVLSAHHDHLGIGKPDARGDNIYNGALDNGAGDATVLAIAKALRALAQPPRRSILVLFPAAEEQNLLGSKYFVEHPPIDPARIVANLNYDCGNIWGRTRDISQVGPGKSSLDAVVRRLAAAQSRVVKPDQFPDRGSFYRSDQLSFAKVGIPAVYLKTGTDFVGRPEGWGKAQILDYEAHRYHQPSDELTDEWNFDGMVEDAQLGFYVALAIADADQAPTWNAGDEFEAARKASTR